MERWKDSLILPQIAAAALCLFPKRNVDSNLHEGGATRVDQT